MPSGWTFQPKGVPTRRQEGGLCGVSPSARSTTATAFNLSDGPGYPIIVEQLFVLPTTHAAQALMASAAIAAHSCSTFKALGYTDRIAALPFRSEAQNSFAVVLRLVMHRKVTATEDDLFIQQNNAVMELSEATPREPDDQLLASAARHAMDRVKRAE